SGHPLRPLRSLTASPRHSSPRHPLAHSPLRSLSSLSDDTGGRCVHPGASSRTRSTTATSPLADWQNRLENRCESRSTAATPARPKTAPFSNRQPQKYDQQSQDFPCPNTRTEQEAADVEHAAQSLKRRISLPESRAVQRRGAERVSIS